MKRPGTTEHRHGDCHGVTDAARDFEVVSFHLAVVVDGIQDDFAHPERLELAREFDGALTGIFRGVVRPDLVRLTRFLYVEYDTTLWLPISSALSGTSSGRPIAAELSATFSTPRPMILFACSTVLTPPP